MERLTERIQRPSKEDLIVFRDDKAKLNCLVPDEMTGDSIRIMLKKLAAYEDAEEQGLLLLLPISKDTPVYSIEYCCGRDKNNQIGMCVRGFCKDCDDKAYFIREGTAEYCSICEIQKSVFLTREAAEAKLKEMSCFQNGNS